MRKLSLIICLFGFFMINSSYAVSVSNIYVVDARNMSLSDKLSMVSLQGIINKNSNNSALFVILRGDDVKWLTDIKNRRTLNIVKLNKNEVLNKYKSNIKGQIIYDETASYTINIATTLSGIKNAVITSKEIKGMPILFDCRNRWKDKVEAYRWAVKNLLKKTSTKMSAILEEHIVSLRDFIIQNNVFVFDLDPINNKNEIKLIKKILSVYKSSTPIIGWPDAKYADRDKGQDNVSVEVAFVKLISPRNIFLVASDFACNLSIYKKLNSEIPLIQLREKKIYNPEKVYLTFVYSDGDNIQYVLNHMRSTLWDDPGRYKLPIGWTIAPLLYDWGSFILEKYYTDAYFSGNDEFVMGPSGFGYVHPTHYKDIDTFLKLTKEYSERLDLPTVAIIDEGNKNEVLHTYKKFADETSLKTIFYVGNIGVRRLINGYDSSIFVLSEDFRANFVEQNISQIKNLVKSGRKMIYCYAHAWDIKPSQLYQVIKGVEDLNIEVVLPSAFSDLLFQKYVYENRPEKSKRELFYAEKPMIYNIKDKWITVNGINFFKVTSIMPASRVLMAEVVYWFNNDNTKKYFRYMENKKNNFFEVLLPPVYKGKVLKYYISVITKDMRFQKSAVYKAKVGFFKDSDNDGLSDDFEINITKTELLSADSDKDGLKDSNDTEPLQPLDNKKEVFYVNARKESQYLWKDYKSLKASDGHRYADNNAYFIYKIPIKDFGGGLELGLLLENNYVVDVSADGTRFRNILRSPYDCHDSGNRGWKVWKLTSEFKDKKYIYIKIYDGSPEDGWGGGVFGIKIFSKWGDVKILNIDTPKIFLMNKKNPINVPIANIYPIKNYKALFYSMDKKKKAQEFKLKYNIQKQILFGTIVPQAEGAYIIKVVVYDEKGNKDEKKKIIQVKRYKEKTKHYKIINSIKILNKQWLKFAGWDEGECGTQQEIRYLFKDNNSNIDGLKHRFADGNNYFIYKFSVGSKVGVLKLKAGNNFVISVSTDLTNWNVILDSNKIYGKDIHNMSNYEEHVVDVSKFLKHGKFIYVKIEDGSKNDGWGGNIGCIDFGVPPVFKTGERVVVEINAREKAVVTADVSSVLKKKGLIYAKASQDFFSKEGYNGKSKYIAFEIPNSAKDGVYKINVIGDRAELRFKEVKNFYISIYNAGIGEVKNKQKIKKGKIKQDKSILQSIKQYFKEFGQVSGLKGVIVDADFVLKNKMRPYIKGWGIGNSGSDAELKYLVYEGGSINPAGMRYADGSVMLLYHFILPKRKRLVVAKITVGNNFVIEVYNYKSKKWDTVCASHVLYGSDIHDMANFKPYYINVTKYVKKSTELKIRVRDGSTNDGWGPCVGNMEIFVK